MAKIRENGLNKRVENKHIVLFISNVRGIEIKYQIIDTK